MDYLMLFAAGFAVGFYVGYKVIDHFYSAFLDKVTADDDEAGHGVNVHIQTYKDLGKDDVERIVNARINESFKNPQYEQN